MIKKIFLFFLLIVGIGISIIAGFFSISGLTTIFKGSELSVLLMGSFLEIAKVNVSVYLHLFGKEIKKALFAYLLIALLILMGITSLGIYGYLSKSFFTSTYTSSMYTKVESMNINLELEKSKIKTARDEIEYLNNMPREDKKNWHIYRIQKLSKDIDGYTTKLDGINEKYITEKVKLNSLESEVGPLKYLAMIIYNDKSQDSIAKSVQIFIIFIVLVFDPLAILVILSAINGFEIIKEKEERDKNIIIHEKIKVNDKIIEEDIIIQKKDDIISVEVKIPEIIEEKNSEIVVENNISDESIEEKDDEVIVENNISESIEEKKDNEIIIENIIENNLEKRFNDNTEKKEVINNENFLPLISVETETEEKEKLHEKILNDNDYIKRIKKIKRKKDKIENKELLDLNEIIFNDEEKIREVVIKPREEIIINREQEFDDDIINSVMDDIFSDNIDKERKDNLDKMYNQIPMVGGKFDDIS